MRAAWAAALIVAIGCAAGPSPPLVEGRPVAQARPGCLPGLESPWQRYQFGRVDGDAVLCGGGGDTERRCWTVDPRSGAVTVRAAAPIPGGGFPIRGRCHNGLCAPVRPDASPDLAAWFVLHPDGARAAIVDGLDVTLFDRATGRATATFPLRGDHTGDWQITNAATEVWFVGDTIYVRGDDAGPASYLFRYDLRGRTSESIDGLYQGGVGLDGDRLLVQVDGLVAVLSLDGVTQPQTRRRTIPRGPCRGGDHAEWTDLGDDFAACEAHLARHYVPYDGARLISVGRALIGVTDTEVFTLDGASLAETHRAPLARCRRGR